MKEDTKMSSLRADEAEYDQELWNNKLKGADFLDLDMVALDHISRKVMKRKLLEWANQVAEEFWTEHYRHRFGDGCPVEYGRFQLRVKEGKWTVGIEWFEQMRNVSGKGKTPFSRHIPLPAGKMKHTMQQFPKALDWEKEIIEKAEKEFKKIREAQAKLKVMMQSVRSIRHVMADKPEGLKLGFSKDGDE